MKKITTAIIITILACLQMNGQRFSLGVKPSLNMVDAKFIEPLFSNVDLDHIISYSFGISGQMRLNNLMAFQVEPRFILKGYNISSGDVNDKIRNGYFSLPTILKIEPINNLNLELGPEVSYLIFSNCINTQYSCFDNYKTGSPKQFELTIIAGLSYTFFEKFDTGMRYGFGLTKYEEGKIIAPDPIDVNYKIYNRYIELYFNIILLNFK